MLRSLVGISVGTSVGCQSSNRTSSACRRSVCAWSGAKTAHRCVTAPWTSAPPTIRARDHDEAWCFSMGSSANARESSILSDFEASTAPSWSVAPTYTTPEYGISIAATRSAARFSSGVVVSR